MKNSWGKIRAIGFDVDGTLYHSSEELQIEVGKDIIAEAARQMSQDPDEIVDEYIKRRQEYRSNTKTLNSFGLPGEEIFQKIWDRVEIGKYIKKDQRLIKLIQKLKKKYRVFLITNGRGEEVERKLKHLGLDHHDFDPRIYCYDQGWIKPDPQPFLAAIEALSMKPEETVYVGDREDVDIEGAQAVGMKTIFVGGKSGKADASCETVYDVKLIISG